MFDILFSMVPVQPFSYADVFAKMELMPYNVRLCIQFLETKALRLILDSNDSFIRARALTEDLAWDERQEKIINLCQLLFDKGCCRPRLDHVNFTQVN